MKGRVRDPGLIYLLLSLALVILLGFLFWKPKEIKEEKIIETEETREEFKEEESVSKNDLESNEVVYIENDDPADLKEDNNGFVLYNDTEVWNINNNTNVEDNIKFKIFKYINNNLNKLLNINYKDLKFKDTLFIFENNIFYCYDNDLKLYYSIEIKLDNINYNKNIISYAKVFIPKYDNPFYIKLKLFLEDKFYKYENINVKKYKIETELIKYNEIPYILFNDNILNEDYFFFDHNYNEKEYNDLIIENFIKIDERS